MIEINKPFLPNKEEYAHYVDQIWKRNWLTNNGPVVKELEAGLKLKLGIDNCSFVSNGTIALQIAIKALNITGEVITTPFSFVATTSCLVWENCEPVFVDIDAKTMNIDANLIEDAITPETSAILATHVYGNPCDIEKISRIAEKHNLKVIYDAAHCFGTTYNGKCVLSYGDISTISFHATKLFHTIEGGAIVCKDKHVHQTVNRMRNFGHDGPYKFEGVGINGKNSELHAAMGMVNLKYVDSIVAKRKSDYKRYIDNLRNSNIEFLAENKDSKNNYSYMPIVFKTEEICVAVLNNLDKYGVKARRYFYPCLSDLPYVKSSGLLVANDVSKRVICLPHYFDLKESEIDMICDVIINSIETIKE